MRRYRSSYHDRITIVPPRHIHWRKPMTDQPTTRRPPARERATLFKRAQTFAAKANFDGAIACMDAVLIRDRQNSTAFFQRGTMKIAKNDIDGAVADLSDAIRIDPRYLDAYINRGNALLSKQ